MTYIHHYTVSVRHHECDANGWVHPSVIVGYMQEAAFSASAAVGYSAQRYDTIGLNWFAYETDLQFLHPLRYGDTLTIRTWVHDFRRVRSLRNYELIRGDGTFIAHGNTDWVLIDTAKLYPTTIPPEVISAYSQGEPVQSVPPRAPFAKIPPPPVDAFTTRRRVEPRDIDMAQHVNNAVYIAYVADARYLHLRSHGLTPQRMREAGGTITPRHYQIVYKQAATLGDEIDVTTWIENITDEGGIRYTLMTRVSDQKVLTQVRTEWAWLTLDNGQPAPLPRDILDILRARG